jgi:iron complex outermembrane receptor protein
MGALLVFAVGIVGVAAQDTGTISGRVTSSQSGEGLPYINVVLKGTSMGAATKTDGSYEVKNVPAGTYTLVISAVGYETVTMEVVVTASGTATADAQLTDKLVVMGDVTVIGASKFPQRLTEAPAAVSAITATTLQREAISGQIPNLLESTPGVDVASSNMFDVNVNTRGFNTTLNRRVLILLDNREMSIPLLGATRWDAFSVPIEDLGSLEIVRGPGSALFGANAYSGVINITTPAPATIEGTKVSLGGGELSMFRADARHAGSSGDWSYRINVGRAQTDSFAKSRNKTAAQIAQDEYSGLTPERFALDGGPLTSLYGSARLDRAFGNSRFLTFEGGGTKTENEVFVTGIGRVQVLEDMAPWGRINFSSNRFFVQLYANGRSTDDQLALSSGATLKEHSSTLHGEFQYNTDVKLGSKNLRVVFGASHRLSKVDTKATLTPEKIDENYSGVYGQLQLALSSKLTLVGASRFDRSSLYDSEFSPKAAVVFSPNINHTFRATYNKAFQSGNYSEYFLSAPAAAPINLTPIGLGVVPVLARGNENLEVEEVNGFEIGYKGILGKKFFVTVDAYKNNLTNFITDLLPGVNPDFAYTKTAQENALLNAAANANPALRPLLPGFTRINGQAAFVFSYTNEGEVDEQGIELGINYYLSKEWFIDANATWFDFEIKSKQAGDQLIPNTPDKKFNVGVAYNGSKFNGSVKYRHVPSFDWAAGIFVGRIKEYDIFNAALGYQINQNFRVGVNALNLTDEEHYEIFGGAILGRRILGNVQATF